MRFDQLEMFIEELRNTFEDTTIMMTRPDYAVNITASANKQENGGRIAQNPSSIRVHQ